MQFQVQTDNDALNTRMPVVLLHLQSNWPTWPGEFIEYMSGNSLHLVFGLQTGLQMAKDGPPYLEIVCNYLYFCMLNIKF